MADDSEVEVRFSANTSDAESGIDDVKSKLGEIGDSAEGLTSILGEVAGALAAAFSIDKIAEFAKSTAEAAKQLELLSNLTGLSKTSIESLQYAIEIAGGNADGAAMALTRFERNLYDATAAAGPAFDAFKDIGVSLDDLQHQSAESVLSETINKLSSMTDASRKNADALAIGGRSFAGFVASLEGGQSAIDGAHSKLVEMGADMDPKMISSFAALDTSLKNAGEAIAGLGRHILQEFIGPIMTAVGWVETLASALSKFIAIHDEFATAMTRDEDASDNDAAMAKKWTDALSGASGASASMGSQKINRKKPPASSTNKDDDSAQQRGVYEETYAVQKEYDQLAVQSHKMSSDQMFADLQVALSKEHGLIDESFEQQMALYGEDSKEYKKLLDQKQIADQKYLIESMKLQQEQVKNNSKVWTDAFNTIEHSFDSMLKGVLQGTTTWQKAMQNLVSNLAVSFIEFEAKRLAEGLKTELQLLLAHETSNAQKTASDEATALAAQTSQATATSKTIMQDASEAAANVYANVAAIPYVGWILAPPAAAAAFAAVAAFDSFDKGTSYVPNDMLAQIHKGEMIIPARQAEAMRTGGLGQGGGGGGSVGFHITAMDGADVMKTLMKNKSAVGTVVKAAMRSGHSGLRGAAAGR